MYRKNIIAEVSRNICVKQIEEWEIARNMPKLVNYNKFKSEFSVPKYIMYNLTIRERSSIAKLCCGKLPLKVETGCYRNVPRDQRLCHNCHVVEDEVNFLTECELYNDIRNTMTVNLNIDRLMNDDIFKVICKYASPHLLSCYITNALITRRNIM